MQEQASAVAQVSRAVSQVEKVMQANTSTAEKSAAASGELSAQAERLNEMVGRFKLE